MRILKINSLPSVSKKRWIDRDRIMLHACFQILVDFVEKEEGDAHVCYEATKDWVDKVRALYAWWIKRRDWVYGEDFDNIDIQDEEDQEKLKELVELRLSLWT